MKGKCPAKNNAKKKRDRHEYPTTGLPDGNYAGIFPARQPAANLHPVQRSRHQYKDVFEIKKKDYPPLVRICKLFCVLYMHFPPEELGEMAKEATELWAEGIREKEKRK